MVSRSEVLPFGQRRLANFVKKIDHEKNQIVLSEVANGIWMYLDLSSLVERDIYYLGFYRPWVWKEFKEIVSEGDIFFDVGSNVGCYSLFVAQKIGPTGCVYAFEPDPNCFDKLKRNVELNYYDDIKAKMVAVSNSRGEAALHKNARKNINQAQSALAKLSSHEKRVKVRKITIDDFVEKESVAKIDVLKIDAQGGEMNVLDGGIKTIRKYMPKILVRVHEEKCRAHGHTSKEAIDTLLGLGYEVTEIRYRRKPRRIFVAQEVEDSTFLATVGKGIGER